MSAEPLHTRLAPLLGEKARQRASGLLVAQRGKARRLLCLEEGQLVYVASNVLEEQLDEFMVRRGLLPPAARASLALQARQSGRQRLAMLVESPAVSREVVRGAAEELTRELCLATLKWREGACSFTPGRPALPSDFGVRLDPAALVLAWCREAGPDADAIRARLGPPDQPFEAAAHPGAVPPADPLAARLLQRTRQGVRLGDLLAEGCEDEGRVLRTVYALKLLGWLRPAPRRRPPVAGTHQAPLSEAECLAVLERASSPDLYHVLGVDRTAARSQIQEAYYRLARRFHPDRLRSGSFAHLLPRMEAFFARVTEAYQVLYDPESRRAYDERLEQDTARGREEVLSAAELARSNYVRARECIERRHYSEALRFLENAIQLEPTVALYHLALGELLAGHPRRRAEAEAALERATALDPSLARAYAVRGRLCLRAGEREAAARWFQEALRWDAHEREAHEGLAELARGAAGRL